MSELSFEARQWLGLIPAPDQLVAVIGTRAELMTWGARLLIVLLACALIGRTGLIARVEGMLTDRGGISAGAARLIAVIVFVAILLGGALLPLSGSPMLFLVVALAPVLILALGRLKRWWLVGAPLAAVALFTWAWLPSALPGDGPPAPEGPAKAAVQSLLHQAAIPFDGITLSPARGFDADVGGAPGRAQVRLSRTALSAPLPELKAYVAHLAGHYVHRDVLRAALLLAGAALAAVLAVAWAFRPMAWLVAPGARLQDPAGLPVTAAMLALAVALTTPLLGAVMREANVRADQYALELSREPDGLAAVLVRTWDYRALRPDPLQEAILYTHPPLAERIGRAMSWKDKAAQTR